MPKRGFLLEPSDWKLPKPQPSRRTKPPRTGCDACGLYKGLASPRMAPHGGGRMGIMVVGEAPGQEEDREGIQFRGRAGRMLKRSLARYGVDLDRDCTKANAVACRPVGADGHNREPTPEEVRHCHQRLERDILAAKPELIFALGTTAIAAVLDDAPPGLSMNATTMHGRVVPCRRWGCWVACGLHPAWYVRQDGRFDGRMDEMIGRALARLAAEPELPPLLDPEAFEIVEDVAELEALLGRLGRGDAPVALDYETTGLDPWADGFRVLSLAVTNDPARGWCIPLDHPHALWGEQRGRATELFREFLNSRCPKVIQNWQFEELVSRVAFGVGVNNVVRDTMVCEHVLDNRRGVCGQEFQEYVRYGATRKGATDRSRLAREWLDDLARYNVLDARYGLRWKRDQDAELDDGLTRAYDLFHEAIPVLARCTEHGLGVDMGMLDGLDREVTAEIAKLEDAKTNAACVRRFRAETGEAFIISNHNHKKRMFYGVLGLKPLKPTKTGEGQEGWADSPEMCASDRDSLEHCLEQVPEGGEEALLLLACLDESKLGKLHGTYIKGMRELISGDGLLHPRFHLHTVDSYRSSSSGPNFQNFPRRDPDLARVRRVFRPRNGLFLEADYAGVEVGGYGCITKDARLIECIGSDDPYLRDFHKRYAALLYQKPFADVTKGERFHGKNGFTFPKFYKSTWEGIAASNAGRWERDVVFQVYEEFDREFPGVREWQEENWRLYCERGFVQYLTGFRCRWGKHGTLIPTQTANVPCQGIAFHRLLRAMIDCDAAMRRERMRSCITGQIHDSIETDLVEDEVEEVVDLQRRIMEQVPSGWDWAKRVPWKAEFSIGPNLIDLVEI